MVKRLVFYFKFLLCLNCQAQFFSNGFPILNQDSSGALDFSKGSFKMILIGEHHNQPYTGNIISTYMKILNDNNIFPKYQILEDHPAGAYIMNKYIQTGDEALLDLIEPDKYNYKAYRDARQYYYHLSIDKRFTFEGGDIDRFVYQSHYAVKDILFKKPFYSLETCAGNNLPCKTMWFILQAFDIVKRPLLTDRKGLKRDLDDLIEFMNSKDSIEVINRVGIDFPLLKKILVSYSLGKEVTKYLMENEPDSIKLKREQMMIKNTYSIYQKDSNAVCFGDFGAFHTMSDISKLRKHGYYIPISLASELNNNPAYPLTNNKISSNIIVYSYAYPKHYKFIETNEKEILDIFSKMSEKTIYIKQYSKDKSINLILLKVPKPHYFRDRRREKRNAGSKVVPVK